LRYNCAYRNAENTKGKTMKTRLYFSVLPALAALIGIPHPAQAQQTVPSVPGLRDLGSDTWVATDALGRPAPTPATARPARKDRFVGIFYFLTHGSRAYYDRPQEHLDYSTYGDDPRVLRDNTQIIQQAGGDPLTKPEAWKDGGTYWWGQPAVGYFLADDPWVARKNLQMLTEAGVDTLIFDVTNAPQYSNAYTTVLNTAAKMRREGLATPKFMFITYSSTGPVANSLYDNLYAKGLWKVLWFTWQGKPLIFGDPNGSGPVKTPPRPEVQRFFNWRYSWANTKGPNGNGKDEWEWSDSGDPQLFGWHDSPGKPEEESVLLGGWANGDIGRSFTGGDQPWGRKGQEPPLNALDLPADTDKGLFFSQQWRNALKTDPQFVFVTGWNEWTAGRQYAPGVTMLGHVTQTGQYYFVDEYNQEFSRDAMPMKTTEKGGYGDNYYMQLVDGIREFKGVHPFPVAHGFRRMTPGRFAAWAAVTPEYRAAAGGTQHRDWPGWGGQHYTNTTGRNEIVTAKVACDAKNIMFYVKTSAPLTSYTGQNWMQLLIDADQNPSTGWHGYDYVVSSKVFSAHLTTLKRLSDGKTWLVPYFVSGREMTITIPRARLGLTNLKKTAFDFHWADNVPVGSGDLADWWYNGDSAPDGRFNYRYMNTP